MIDKYGREINYMRISVTGLLYTSNSSYTIYNLMNEEKRKGVAVITVIEDLDVLIEISDRIVVLNRGEISGIVDARTTTKEEIGFLMTNNREEKVQNG